jgi:hypothetical protein
MYFDQYSITSLRYIDISFKNFMAGNLAAGLYISAVSVPAGLICPACVSSVSILFLLPFRHPPFRFFLPFIIVGSAKVRIFFKLPNKINFIFSSLFFPSPSFQYAGFKAAFRSSEPGCKGSNLFFSSNIYFKINPAPIFTNAILSFKTPSSEAGCKSRNF